MVIAPARRAGDPGSIPGPGENFSLKLLVIFDNLRQYNGNSSEDFIKSLTLNAAINIRGRIYIRNN